MPDTEERPEVTLRSLTSFKEEVDRKLQREEGMMARLQRQPGARRTGLFIIAFLLLASTAVIIVRPFGFYIWMLVAFVLVSFAWLLLFLPTTRKARGYWRGRKEISRKKGGLSKSLKFIAKKRKRLLTEAWVNAFFYGNAVPTFAFVLIFGVATFFSLYHAYVIRDLPLWDAWFIVAQSAALIGLRIFLFFYRPYARSMFSLPKDLRSRYGSARTGGMLAVLGAVIFIVMFIAMFSFFIVLGMLLPGTTLAKITEFLEADGGTNTFTIILVFIVEYAILRYFQSITSKRMALKIVESHLERLRSDVIAPLQDMVGRASSGASLDAEEFDRVRADYFRIAIYRIDWHDYFGRAAIYFINPDMKLLLREDVLEVLDRAGGTG